jgi:RNA polymerase sigma-70 factor (ECF subfamily)
MRMTADRDAALDLTQDTLIAGYENLENFRGESSLSTWLFQIAANRTRNFLKRAGRETGLPDGYEQGTDKNRPDTDYEKDEKERLLKNAVAALPDKQRAVFILRYYEQMKFNDIARVQGVSVSAVKTSFAEALKKLKKRLSKI